MSKHHETIAQLLGNFVAFALIVAVTLAFAAWSAVLPTVGMLYLFGALA